MKEIGEVGITYFDTPPDNCFLLPAIITEESYPDLYKVGLEEIGLGNTLFVLSGNTIQIKSPRFPVGRIANDVDFGVLGGQGGFKTIALTIPQMPQHGHTQNSHNHTQDSHNHTQVTHNHFIREIVSAAASGGMTISTAISTSGSNHTWANAFLASVAATNQNTTPTNTNTTATNQHTGGTGTLQVDSNGVAHENLPPYTVVNYWICYGEG